MKVFYISPVNKHSLLFDTFNYDSTNNLEEATVVFFDCYSDLYPYDYNLLQRVRDMNIPVVAFQEKDYGGMSKEVWEGFNLFPHNKKIMFVRKYDKAVNYPKWVYPYELIMYEDHVSPVTTKEELFSRPNDICFIGNLSPQRISVVGELSNHFKVDNMLGLPRIEHTEWLNRHRQAKMFLTSDGGGFGDERPYQLMYISTMLRQKNNQLIIHNFRNGLECIEVSEYPTPQEIKILKDVLSDEDMLYEIYLNGIEKVEKYFNAGYRANYILKKLNQNGIC